jgi:hypothetical protein
MVFIGARTVMPTGSSMGGFLVIDNTTPAPIRYDQACGAPQFAVVLTNSKVRQSPAFAANACPSGFITPGLHRYWFQVSSTYQRCGDGTDGVPACRLMGLRFRPLPAGHYLAAETSDSHPIPMAQALRVIVVPDRPDPTAFDHPKSATDAAVPALSRLRAAARSLAMANDDSAVHNGFVVVTSREHAAGGDIVNTDQPVYEMVLRGRFTCLACSFPPGASAPHGTTVVLTLDEQTLQTTGFGVTGSFPSVLVGDPVYRFRF